MNNSKRRLSFFLIIVFLFSAIYFFSWRMRRETAKNFEVFNVNNAISGNHQEKGLKLLPTNCTHEKYIFGQPIQQTDPCLVEAVQKIYLVPPPPIQTSHRIFNLSKEIKGNVEKFEFVEHLIVKPTFGHSRGKGFFIEAGAHDGEFISSTLRLEKQYNWTGLLIEANPLLFESLLGKKRNAWSINVALCVSEHPTQVPFYTTGILTGTSSVLSGLYPKNHLVVNSSIQCVPLFTILAALKVTTVDFLSLDVEGAELAVLKTVPFDKINFKVMTIEYDHIPVKSGSKKQALNEFLEPRGYKFVKEISDYWTKDYLYVHESLYHLAISMAM